MVTIGCVDGGTHLVTLLNISNNKRSTTALRGFVQAVRKHGVPSRLRIDRGGEKVLIHDFMLHHRGLDRGSCITGKSVHNHRIEAFWRYVMDWCIRDYRDLFNQMETKY